MEISAIVEFLSSVPVWAWVLAAIVVLIIFGDRKLWDYEVKFPLKPGVGRGEVELECMKRKGTLVECTFELEPAYANKAVAVFLNGQQIHEIAASKNTSGRWHVEEAVAFSRPSEGDQITVRIGGEEVFSGPLVLD